MLLAIDIGNSATKAALFEGQNLKTSFSIPSTVPHDPDALGALIAQKLDIDPANESTVERIAICSVVPQLTPLFYETAFDFFGIEPWQLDYTADLGMKNLYNEPRQVGPDRLANALAAKVIYGPPVVVVDLGTATKFDVVNADGDFAGGAIAPGVMTAAQELFRRAARLHPIELRKPQDLIARETGEAMRSGIFYSAIGAIDYMIEKIAAELKASGMKAIGTGGMAAVLKGHFRHLKDFDDYLTLRGICLAYWRNNQ